MKREYLKPQAELFRMQEAIVMSGSEFGEKIEDGFWIGAV